MNITDVSYLPLRELWWILSTSVKQIHIYIASGFTRCLIFTRILFIALRIFFFSSMSNLFLISSIHAVASSKLSWPPSKGTTKNRNNNSNYKMYTINCRRLIINWLVRNNRRQTKYKVWRNCKIRVLNYFVKVHDHFNMGFRPLQVFKELWKKIWMKAKIV